MRKIRLLSMCLLVTITTNIGLGQETVSVDYGYLLAQSELNSKADLVVNTAGWGGGAFVASVLLSPLLGGGITVLMAGNVKDVSVPTTRRQAIMDKYPNSADAYTYYEDHYIENYTILKKKGQKSAAWKGVGAGFLVNLIIIAGAS